MSSDNGADHEHYSGDQIVSALVANFPAGFANRRTRPWAAGSVNWCRINRGPALLIWVTRFGTRT